MQRAWQFSTSLRATSYGSPLSADDDGGGGYRGCPAGFPTAEASPAVAVEDGSGGSVLRLRLQRHYPPVNLSAIDWSALRWRGAVYVPQRPLASADDDADDFYSAESAASHVRDVRLARRLGATALLVQRASHRLSTHDEFLNATDGRATAAGALGTAALGGREEGEMMAVVLEFSIDFEVYGNLREPVRQQRAVNDFYAFVSEHCSHRSVAAWLIGGAPNDPVAWTADLVPAFLGVIDALVAAACAAERAAGGCRVADPSGWALPTRASCVPLRRRARSRASRMPLVACSSIVLATRRPPPSATTSANSPRGRRRPNTPVRPSPSRCTSPALSSPSHARATARSPT